MLIYNFIPQGSTVKSKKEILYLDVGNALKKGIIDHHQPSAPKLCATMLVYKYPKYIPKQVKTIVLHKSPDLDCIASSFLVEYYLKYKRFPKYAYKLATFVNKIDFGKSPKYTISLYSLFTMIKSELNTDVDIVKFGHKLIKECSKYGFDTNKVPPAYKDYVEKIKLDKALYSVDFHSSKIIKLNLPFKNHGGVIQVECLLTKQPKSKLFKEWARNDSLHSEDGFCMLIVQLNSRRTIISVKPDGFVYLKGLGEMINKWEKIKREKKGIILDEPNRLGYDMPDPWYDGRNLLHNYTIIDSPRRGTELTFGEIVDIAIRWSENV